MCRDAAVKAAAEAMLASWRIGPDPSSWAVARAAAYRDATAAVDAAAPHLLAAHEADAAERIAQAIDQAWAEVKDAMGTDDFTSYREGYLDGLEHAEGIARTALANPTTTEADA